MFNKVGRPTRFEINYKIFAFLLLPTLFLFSLGGCEIYGKELAFETIELTEYNREGKRYRDKNPTVFVVSKAENLSEINDLILEESLPILHSLDYDSNFVIGVYRGERSSSGYSAEIIRISKRGSLINIFAEFEEPQQGYAYADEMTSPYHLVVVEKAGSWSRKFKFNLIVDGKTVASNETFIP